MGSAFYTGVSGMMGFQSKLDIVAHNIANVNTMGYKRQRASFSDLLYTNMNIHGNYNMTVTQQAQQAALGAGTAPITTPDGTVIPGAAGNAGLSNDRLGHGSRISSVDLLYSQSGLFTTDRPLDFAVTGEGCFFAVEGQNGMEYTRNGAFQLSMQGKSAYLVTADGASVLDNRGRPIKLAVDEDGQPDFEGLTEKIGVYHFTNPYGLIPTGSSRYMESEVSGVATALRGRANEPEHTVRQFALEYSNVDLGSEMVEMMQAQRAFQLNSRVVQTADQIDEVINNLR